MDHTDVSLLVGDDGNWIFIHLFTVLLLFFAEVCIVYFPWFEWLNYVRNSATKFALQMGFPEEDLSSERSK